LRASGRALLLAFATSLIGTMAFRLSAPAIAYYVSGALGGSLAELGLLTTAFFLIRAVFAILMGRLADKGVRLGLAASSCFLAHAGVVMLYPLASSWVGVLALRVLQGALNGLELVEAMFFLSMGLALAIAVSVAGASRALSSGSTAQLSR